MILEIIDELNNTCTERDSDAIKWEESSKRIRLADSKT